MVVKCEVQECGYNVNGICNRMIVVSLNTKGMCSWMYFPNGQLKATYKDKPEEQPWWAEAEELGKEPEV